MSFWRKYIIAAFFIATGIVGLAQPAMDTIRIREVQVTGRRPVDERVVQETRVDTLILQALQTVDVSELLSAHTPVYIKSYGRGSAASASFRGTAASHTKVYWNGMALNSSMRSDADFSLFPVYFIDDLGLQHGGSSLLSGAGALGGSILLGNKPDWSNRRAFHYVHTAESFATSKHYFTARLGKPRFQSVTRLFSDRAENDFPFYNYGVLPMYNDRQTNAAYRKEGFLQEFYGRPGQNHSLSARLWAYQSHRQLPQLMSYEGVGRNEHQDDRNLRALLNWKHYRDQLTMEWNLGMNWSELDYFRSSTEAGFVNFDSRSREKTYSSQFSAGWNPSERLSLQWKADAARHQVQIFDRAQQTGYDHTRTEFLLMQTARLQVHPRVAFLMLVRSEHYDEKLIGFIPLAGVEWQTGSKEQWLLKSTVSRNYHKPSLNDLFWLPGGNPGLLPEDGPSADVSVQFVQKQGGQELELQAAAFASHISNWIVWQPAANGAYYWEAQNLREVFTRGVEMKGAWRRQMGANARLALLANYSFTRTTNQNAVASVDRSRGKQLIYVPKHQAGLFADMQYRSWYMKTAAPFTGKRYTSSSNQESLHEKVLTAYWLVHVTGGHTFRVDPFLMDVSLRVENLFDRDYMAVLWRPMPGRYYSFNLQIRFK